MLLLELGDDVCQQCGNARAGGCACLDDFGVAQCGGGDAGGQVGDQGDAEDLHAGVACGDGFQGGGHAHQVRADHLGVLDLGRGLVVRAGELCVHALVEGRIDLAGQVADA